MRVAAGDTVVFDGLDTYTNYEYTVDWGDGSAEQTYYTDVAEHPYSTTGTYTVTVNGTLPHTTTEEGSAVLVSVEQWGDIKWESM